jgi:hypothetical protein
LSHARIEATEDVKTTLLTLGVAATAFITDIVPSTAGLMKYYSSASAPSISNGDAV